MWGFVSGFGELLQPAFIDVTLEIGEVCAFSGYEQAAEASEFSQAGESILFMQFVYPLGKLKMKFIFFLSNEETGLQQG